MLIETINSIQVIRIQLNYNKKKWGKTTKKNQKNAKGVAVDAGTGADMCIISVQYKLIPTNEFNCICFQQFVRLPRKYFQIYVQWTIICLFLCYLHRKTYFLDLDLDVSRGQPCLRDVEKKQNLLKSVLFCFSFLFQFKIRSIFLFHFANYTNIYLFKIEFIIVIIYQ